MKNWNPYDSHTHTHDTAISATGRQTIRECGSRCSPRNCTLRLQNRLAYVLTFRTNYRHSAEQFRRVPMRRMSANNTHYGTCSGCVRVRPVCRVRAAISITANHCTRSSSYTPNFVWFDTSRRSTTRLMPGSNVWAACHLNITTLPEGSMAWCRTFILSQ